MIYMDDYKQMLKKENYHHLALLVALVIYSVFNIKTPSMLANVVDTIYGNLVVMLTAFYILAKFNPIVGVVALFAGYELIRRSSHSNGELAIQRYLPSEMKKSNHLTAFNQFPVTLEEEMVKKMAPLVETSGPSNLNYKPMNDDTHHAMNVQDTLSIV